MTELLKEKGVYIEDKKWQPIKEPVIVHAPDVPFTDLPKIEPVRTLEPHHVDISYEKQMLDWEANETELQTVLEKLKVSPNDPELLTKVQELQTKSDEKTVMAKVCTKIYSEIQFARQRMSDAIFNKEPTDNVRQRLSWLEDRLETLLHREKIPQILPKIRPPPPVQEDRQSSSETQEEDLDDLLNMILDKENVDFTRIKEPKTYRKEMKAQVLESKEEPEQAKDETLLAKPIIDEPLVDSTQVKLDEIKEITVPAPKIDEQPIKVVPVKPPSLDSLSSDDDENLSSLHDDDITDEESITSSWTSEIARRERRKRKRTKKIVKITAPESDLDSGSSSGRKSQDLILPPLEIPIDAYWKSEHHRFAYSEHKDSFVNLNPSTYHCLGLATPGTYIEPRSDKKDTLPWMPKRKDSDFGEVHKEALDSVLDRVHTFYDEIYKAAQLSLDQVQREQGPKSTFVTAMQGLDMETAIKLTGQAQPTPRGATTRRSVYNPLPLLIPEKKPVTKIQREPLFPRTSYDFCGPLTSQGREKAITGTQVDAELVIGSYKGYFLPPPSRDFWTNEEPTKRLVNQKTLYADTQFTGSIYKRNVLKAAALKGIDINDQIPSLTARVVPSHLAIPSNVAPLGLKASRKMSTSSRKSVSSIKTSTSSVRSNKITAGPTKKPAIKSGTNSLLSIPVVTSGDAMESNLAVSSETSIDTSAIKMITFKKKAQMLKDINSFASAASSKWPEMRPISGALEHSGLKWERIKDLVHNTLTSSRPLERQEAARALGKLRCADTMVLFAMKNMIDGDPDPQVQFEVCRALLQLGCWENKVMEGVTRFLDTQKMADNVLIAMLDGVLTSKNAQFVDKRLPAFNPMVSAIDTCCESTNPTVAYKAAHTLGKLCIANVRARNQLFRIIETTKNHSEIVESIDVIIRNMNCRDWKLIDKLVHEMRWCPSSQGRATVAKLFIFLGPRYVMKPGEEQAIFELLETRLWDDPCKDVRLEIARALMKLELFDRVCERAEKKLGSRDEDTRAQGIISIGTLALRNDRIIRTLLDMLELDSSEYIRILILRAFADIGVADRRIMRSLREKKRAGNITSREASKTLKILQATA